ncbi:MAG: hypothetical protein QOE90_2198 [Thermoplasmata archaeon]|nr:hypothetical protein [Thermoplasmata archaeon]
MRLLSLLVLGALLLPLGFAAPQARHDETLKLTNPGKNLGDPSDDSTVYVSACRGVSLTQRFAVNAVDDCLTSGVYGETNKVDGLQVRAGEAMDGDVMVAYAADPSLLA